MGCHFISGILSGYKRSQLLVLVRDLFTPGPVLHDQVVEELIAQLAFFLGVENCVFYLITPIHPKLFQKAEIADLRCVGNKADHRILKVMPDLL